MKKLVCALTLCLLLAGCSSYEKYQTSWIGPFDTMFSFIMYDRDENHFKKASAYCKEQLEYYHKLFDKYNDYEGVNNVKTINDQAGIAPVKVDAPLFELLNTTLERQKTISAKVDITMGAVLNVWHDYREKDDGSVPELEELQAQNEYSGLNHLVLDEKNQTAYLDNPDTQLDIGAVAKGYACELLKNDLKDAGYTDFIISGGGNIVALGKRPVPAEESELSKVLPDCKEYFTVDIQSPLDGAYANKEALAAFLIKDQAAVTSGDYQRFYEGADGVIYHHLIDPDTLFPARYCRSVTVICPDSGLADFLSTTLFLMPVDEGKALLEKLPDTSAIWLLNDGTLTYSGALEEGVNCHFYTEVVE